MNQGRGIELFRTKDEFVGLMKEKPINSLWVAQKYIERPLLYQGRKFDIRVWVVVTANIDIFMYKEGYLRTSSFGYDMDNENNYVHLTNNCL